MAGRMDTGEPGCGKSIGAIETVDNWLREMIYDDDRELFVFDPHGPLAREVGKLVIEYGFGERMTYDRIEETERVPRYQVFTPECDMEAQKDAMMDAAAMVNAMESRHGHTLYEDGISLSADILAGQKEPVDFWDIRHALRLGHPVQRRLFDGITEQETRDKTAYLFGLTKFERDKRIDVAVRLFDKWYRNSWLRVRLGTGKPWSAINVLEGSQNVSGDSLRTLGILLLMGRLIDAMKSGKSTLIVVDEAIDLVTPWLVRKVEELRKFNVELVLLLQGVDTTNYLHRRLLQASAVKRFYRCSDPVLIEYMSKHTIGATSGYAVHSKEKRLQQFRTGDYDREERPLFELHEYEAVRYKSRNDEMQDFASVFVRLNTGEYAEIAGGRVRFGVVEDRRLFGEWSSVGDEMLEEFLEKQRERLVSVPAAVVEESKSAAILLQELELREFSRVERDPLSFGQEHCFTPKEIAEIAGVSYATAGQRITRGVKRGLVFKIGEIQWSGAGRTIGVFLRRNEKIKNLMHEVLVSKWFLPFWLLGFDARRGMDTDARFRADLEFDRYYVEMDRDTEKAKQVTERLRTYRSADGFVLMIVPSEKRAKDVLRLEHGIPEKLLVTTLKRTIDDPFGMIWQDSHENWTDLRIHAR